jgi:hypothetical protein
LINAHIAKIRIITRFSPHIHAPTIFALVGGTHAGGVSHLTAGVSIALALIHMIEKSKLRIGKHIEAVGLGTILITLLLLVIPDVVRTIV